MINDLFFRELSVEEKTEFKQWAKDHFIANMEVNDLWHPFIRAQIEILQNEINGYNSFGFGDD